MAKTSQLNQPQRQQMRRMVLRLWSHGFSTGRIAAALKIPPRQIVKIIYAPQQGHTRAGQGRAAGASGRSGPRRKVWSLHLRKVPVSVICQRLQLSREEVLAIVLYTLEDKLPPEIERVIERHLAEDKLSLKQIARRVGVSPATVHRLAHAIPDDPRLVNFKTVSRYTCPACDRTTTTKPCVTCTARAARTARQQRQAKEIPS